jgi:hypothetical protein
VEYLLQVRKLRPEKAIEATETTRLTDTDIEASTVTKSTDSKKVSLATDMRDSKKSRRYICI